MFKFTTPSAVSRWFAQLLGFCFVLLFIVAVLSDDAFAPFLLILTVGGVIGGLLMLLLVRHTDRTPPLAVPDSFQRDMLGMHVIDASRIRVAGLGGLGLLAMAVALGFFIPAIGISLALGVLGGILLSFALASYRRHRAGRWP